MNQLAAILVPTCICLLANLPEANCSDKKDLITDLVVDVEQLAECKFSQG